MINRIGMDKRIVLLFLLTLSSSIVVAPFSVHSISSGDDWSMLRHDPAHTGYTTTKPLTGFPEVIWSQAGGYQGVSASPAVANGVVYTTAADLYAFNASTGEGIWSASGGGWGTNAIVVGDFVYCGGIAYDALTGSELWSPNPTGARVPQAFAYGYLYAYAYNTSFPQVGAGVVALLCLNATTGAEIWRIPVDFISTDPAVANGILYIAGSKGTFYALDAYTGNMIWTYPLEASPSSSGSTPAVYGGIVYIGSFWDGNVYALNASNGRKIWNYTTGAFVESSPAVAYGIVYIGSDDGNFYALNATSGAKIWNYTTSGGMSSPAVAGDVVYVGGWNGNLYALNASTGDKLWNYTVQPPGFLEYEGLHTSPAVSDGRVYMGSNDYLMIVLAEGSANPSPPPSPPIPEFQSWIILPVVAVASVIVVVVSILLVHFKKLHR
jgi:outer membrane protein assembly factor BamB